MVENDNIRKNYRKFDERFLEERRKTDRLQEKIVGLMSKVD